MFLLASSETHYFGLPLKSLTDMMIQIRENMSGEPYVCPLGLFSRPIQTSQNKNV